MGASLIAKLEKTLPAMQETLVWVWIGKIPWRRERLPNPVFCPGEFHGQRSLAGYSPWGHKESDMTERLTLSLLLSPGYLPEPGIKPESPALQADSLPLNHQ